MDPERRDRQVRLRAFEFLAEQTALHGEVLRWPLLIRGFDFEGRRVPLASQQGIFKPAVLAEIPLSIRTAPVSPGEARPYEDGMEEDGLLLYRYRGTYRDRCAICRLRHAELLEAAHILPDGHPRGEPIVPNGLALCKLHHAAFDRHILGIRPDLIIEVRRDILEETDGPMLQHGLQEIEGTAIRAPRSDRLRPRADFLEERYEIFKKAS